MDIIITIMLACIFAGLAGLYLAIKNWVGKIPDRIHEMNIEEFRNKNSRELQIESFFREVSGEKIANLLDDWTTMLTDPTLFSQKSTEEIKSMLKELLVYGSSESVRRAACYQQYNYQLSELDKENKPGEAKNIKTATMFYLIAYIVVQLKKDFTGYDVNPDDLIRLKITDYEDMKHSFEIGKKKAEDILNI